MTPEETRLKEDRERKAYWRRWGPYLSDRQWGTVREDYSPDGSAWDYFTHDQARSRAYRWGEDGIAGISDNHQRLCFAIALWNEEDPILKERFFGLTGKEGNHGEDVKEYYFYLDNTPTHSYMKCLYKYPHKAFPYSQLVEENKCRRYQDREFELLDTGVFDSDAYFDIFVEYAKNSPEDILIQISAVNRGTEEKTLHLLPTLWFRNTWSWNHSEEKPRIKRLKSDNHLSILEATEASLGERWLYCEGNQGAETPPLLLFTENETNQERLFGVNNPSPYVKDGINNYLVSGQEDAVNPNQIGTKFAADYILKIGAGETKVVRLRLSDSPGFAEPFGVDFDTTFQNRKREADEFYEQVTSPCSLTEEKRNIQRQAFAGMLWNKQFYHYVVEEWLKGDAIHPAPKSRRNIRNSEWIHLFNDDIISMPDKWEYPWFAAWDLAFHVIPLATIDPDFAKRQLDRLTREWYMHPNGQLPAYEWDFSDGNPPVHAWATFRIYKIEQKMYGCADKKFLERVFQKLLLNFTWWVNRKDIGGKNVFQGGFLGMDNIGVFDRNVDLPTGGNLEQSDGTSWMGMYCLNMLAIALELAPENSAYEDIASKFFEHFLYIADAMNCMGDAETSLWDEADGFYYDMLHLPDGSYLPLKVRSMVGLIPLLAVATIEPETLEKLPGFQQRMQWFIQNRPNLKQNVACMETPGVGARRLLAIAYRDKLRRILEKMLDENEFLSPYGIRSVSKFHAKNPYIFGVNGEQYRVDYEPAESSSGLFGGNSNWRGPIWFPINYLIIESLQKFHYYLGDDFQVECPTGSGQMMNLWEVATELSQRLTRIFLQDESGKRPVYGDSETFQNNPHWRDLILFYEYFHGDNGAGLGASHQTGWTGVVAKLIQQCGEYGGQNQASKPAQK
ncbi:glucosidase [Coleofasciculus sp. FACHB-1120]|uniref:MGH1-like glycoside hydrolase domain-containing protein n=1 Tax=Coleofasciculus sp. FACHB-1120 TaxID=2692783 RepID=UPI001688AAA0|nr:glucosidase [Coleofasciculus sp. FACHB-1120]MBD2743023.1 glucosidase [Coleofasciculus sp. FACHB-1120]